MTWHSTNFRCTLLQFIYNFFVLELNNNQKQFYIYKRRVGSLYGWRRIHSRERKIAAGTGGGVGICEPVGWYPLASANHEIWTGVPSGAYHCAVPTECCPPIPSSCTAMPFEVSNALLYEPSSWTSLLIERMVASLSMWSAKATATRAARTNCKQAKMRKNLKLAQFFFVLDNNFSTPK